MRFLLSILLFFGFGHVENLHAQFRLAPENGCRKFEFDKSIKGHSLTVFIFNSPECPICKKYCIGISSTVENLDSMGIGTYFVYHSYLANKSRVRGFHSLNNIGVPETNIILDPDLILVERLDATVTPQFILVDSSGAVIYSGRLDNRFESLGVERKIVTEKYLIDAVLQFRSGDKVKVPRTEPVGCIITR